jgi:hypothetical protein
MVRVNARGSVNAWAREGASYKPARPEIGSLNLKDDLEVEERVWRTPPGPLRP